ncbi:MAG: hypothetical protein EBS86_12635 [Crocinitomicaceae bacterium]|nr:hypothetical protein [Crocinitomicaceae bacterium]
MIDNGQYIAKFEHTKNLVISSFFFIVPSIYAWYYDANKYSILLLLTTLISANYWRKATYSWRRNTDLVFSKISFAIFFCNGIVYVKQIQYQIVGYIGIVGVIYCYYQSAFLLAKKNNNWWKYHFAFHFLIMIEQIIVLHHIV